MKRAVVRALPDEPKARRLPLVSVELLLQAQSTLSAVERFAERSEAGELPENARYYRDLIPLGRPAAGQQYGFEVDLDACTGCKACVVACHTLNGLDESETFRTVGLLQGGTPEAPALQTVTTSCHHCLEPACLEGCPVKAYEKDPLTGIVKHLDDQCFGCQYCTLMCPYDAPKYNEARGIVRKCDMCSDRLAHGEAPACVQACPSGAIAVRIVEREAVVAAANAGVFLAGAPSPQHTHPTTIYASSKANPGALQPVDLHRNRREHAPPSLVLMLTLTQLSTGLLGSALAARYLFGEWPIDPELVLAVSLVTLLSGLVAAVFHLGRPKLAWRAVLGVKTSWLSREALAFGLFAQLLLARCALGIGARWSSLDAGSLIAAAKPALASAAFVSGAAGVFCSVMVYAATRREHWSALLTGAKFLGTSLLLGAASLLALAVLTRGSGATAVPAISAATLAVSVIAVAKLSFEASLLRHPMTGPQAPLRRMAELLLGELRWLTLARFALGVLGGLILPSLLGFTSSRVAAAALSVGMLVLLAAGELCERSSFFMAAPASRMPGGLP